MLTNETLLMSPRRTARLRVVVDLRDARVDLAPVVVLRPAAEGQADSAPRPAGTQATLALFSRGGVKARAFSF